MSKCIKCSQDENNLSRLCPNGYSHGHMLPLPKTYTATDVQRKKLALLDKVNNEFAIRVINKCKFSMTGFDEYIKQLQQRIQKDGE